MKIYFQNRAARLKCFEGSCENCPFFKPVASLCPWNSSTIVDCYGKGHWVCGESSYIFKL